MNSSFKDLTTRYYGVRKELNEICSNICDAGIILTARKHRTEIANRHTHMQTEILAPVGNHSPKYYADELITALDSADNFILEVAKRY